MDKISSVSTLAVPLLVMLVIGVVLRRKKMITPQGISDIKTIIINVCLPAVIFTAFYNAEYNASTAIITVVIFSILVAALLVGFLFKKIFKIKKEVMPFLNTGFESGMLGYTLFALLFGAENLGYYAITDFGQEIFIFTVFMTMLNLRNSPDYTIKKALRNIFTAPPFLAIIAGVIVGVTGLGRAMDASQVGAVINSAVSFMSAPISALILLVIGYSIELSRPNLKASFQTIALRVVTVYALYLLAFFLLNALLPMNPLNNWALLLFFILPPPFVVPIFVRKEAEQPFIATTLSIYSLFSIAAYIILAYYVV